MILKMAAIPRYFFPEIERKGVRSFPGKQETLPGHWLRRTSVGLPSKYGQSFRHGRPKVIHQFLLVIHRHSLTFLSNLFSQNLLSFRYSSGNTLIWIHSQYSNPLFRHNRTGQTSKQTYKQAIRQEIRIMPFITARFRSVKAGDNPNGFYGDMTHGTSHPLAARQLFLPQISSALYCFAAEKYLTLVDKGNIL